MSTDAERLTEAYRNQRDQALGQIATRTADRDAALAEVDQAHAMIRTALAERDAARESRDAALARCDEAKSDGMDEGATIALHCLAGWLNVKEWEGGDGSETFNGDVGAEVINIFKAAGWPDGAVPTPQIHDAALAEVKRLREALERADNLLGFEDWVTINGKHANASVEAVNTIRAALAGTSETQAAGVTNNG